MKARLRKFLVDLGETFWLLPAAMVAGALLLAVGMVRLDRDGLVPSWALQGPWLYTGGGTGARTLLGAVASSTIGVAGTVFSITIAALTLAAGQMGPRLLRNFVRDRGSQVTLGTFLGTFAYALMVLRSVRTKGEGDFVPHLSLTIAIVFAICSVAVLVFFVGHMAGRINVDTVIDLVSGEVRSAIARLTLDEAQEPPRDPAPASWRGAVAVLDERRGYLQALDRSGLAAWADGHDTVIRLLVRPGDHVFPGAAIALALPAAPGVEAAIRDATALGSGRMSAADLEFAIRQLVEVAVRALSPGINDPHTALSVLDHLGDALCSLSGRHLPDGCIVHGGRVRLVVPTIDYDGLLDACFHLIRQNAAGSATVLIRMTEVLTAIAGCERDAIRLAGLSRHASLIRTDAERDIPNADDLADLVRRHGAFETVRSLGALAVVLDDHGPTAGGMPHHAATVRPLGVGS